MPPIVQLRPATLSGCPSLQACFGVGCAQHHRCARYEAVSRTEASRDTLGTCLSAGRYPLFVDLLSGD